MPTIKENIELLKVLVEIQRDTTRALAELNETTKQMNATLTGLNEHFRNGFRQELKQHITEEINRPSHWIRASAAVTVAVGAIATVILMAFGVI